MTAATLVLTGEAGSRNCVGWDQAMMHNMNYPNPAEFTLVLMGDAGCVVCGIGRRDIDVL